VVTQIKVPPFREIFPDGTMRHNMTAPQLAAMQSKTRFTWLLCGTQFGKTILLPVWLYDKIQKHGNGDYLAGTTNFPLMDKKLLPAFDEYFHTVLKVAKYKDKGCSLNFYNGRTRIMFFTAEKPSSIESATAIAGVLDEVGQDEWKEKTWEAYQSRLSIASDPAGLNAGESLGATTLYNFAWLKYRIYDEWLRDIKDGVKSIHTIIHADSIENPTFPLEEYERQRKILSQWQFDLRYRGRYTKPAGLVYSMFNSEDNVIPRHRSPVKSDWPRYCGLDFGDDTAAIFYAIDPSTGDLYADAEYYAAGRSTEEHANELKRISQGWNIIRCVGGKGDPGDDGWRGDFTKSGWRVSEPPIRPVEQGIQRVRTFHADNKIYTFTDMVNYLREKMSYSYKLDNNKSTGEIEGKQRYHMMDAERYILASFTPVNRNNKAEFLRVY
jgi:hypothetical protein